MSARPSTLAFLLLGSLLAAFAACFTDAVWLRAERGPELVSMRLLAAQLGLSDLALFTEARYTRHPAQADLHSGFQDHPLALEHFPSGSLMVPRYDGLVREATTPD